MVQGTYLRVGATPAVALFVQPDFDFNRIFPTLIMNAFPKYEERLDSVFLNVLKFFQSEIR